MSITNDLRAYADSAVDRGRQTLSSAQSQLGGVNRQAGDFVGKVTDTATEAVTDLRESAEKIVNVDALRTAIEPYLSSLRSYGDSVSERVDELVATLRKDPRFAKLFDTADSVSDVVLELVQERVVKPVQSFAGSASSRQPARKPSPRPGASTTTSASKSTPKSTSTRPATTRKPATTTTARKAPAKKSATS
jgi:hypothetical protein